MNKKGSNYCIYRHLKPNGEVFYIGIGNLKRPYKKQDRSNFWNLVVNKYGYEIQVLKSDLSWEDACELEKILISWHKRRDCCGGTLVNLTDGGEGTLGKKYSDESKKKMSDSRKGRFCGENSHSFGKPKSDETKKRISESRKGIKWTEEQHIKAAEYNKLNPRPQEVRDKISQSTKGALSSHAKKTINVFSKEIYNCVQEVSDLIGISKTTLVGWLNGMYPNKSDFVYLENYDENKLYTKYIETKHSKYKYITKHTKNNKWYVNYKHNGKKIISKYFNTEEEAYNFMISHPLYEK